MIFNIMELFRTGETYKDKHGRTVERGTSRVIETIKAKSKTEAANKFFLHLPNTDKRKVVKDIITADDGMTTQYFAIKGV